MESTNPKSDASCDKISDSSSSEIIEGRMRPTSVKRTGETDLEPLIGSKVKIPGIIHYRHHLAIYLFCGMTVVCAMRQTVSVAMVAMVNDSYVPHQSNHSEGEIETCDENVPVNSSREVVGTNGQYNWNTHTQELLLAGFFYGYIITQIPGGWLSDRFGMKWVISGGILISSVGTLLSPASVQGGAAWYFVLRFCCGLGEGLAFPSTLSLWSKWAHPNERSRLGISASAGFCAGLFLGNILSGYLVELGIAGGWPFPYYLFGALGCLWFVVWAIAVYSTPDENPWISQEEKDYINDGLKHQDTKTNDAVPWLSILLSPAMWALNVTHFCFAGVVFTIMTNLPLYYSDGIRLPVQLAGVYSALPFIIQFFSILMFGYISDRLLTSRILSKQMTRKVMAAAGFSIGGLCFMFAGFSRCHVGQSVTFITLAMAASGPVNSGHFVALLDVSGRFAGSAMGLMNLSGAIGGVIGPYVVGIFTEVQSDIRGWQKVMWLLGAWYMIGGVVYVIFGTVELQPWARPKDNCTDESQIRTKYGTTDSRNGFADTNYVNEND